jgi:hypothetical protein
MANYRKRQVREEPPLDDADVVVRGNLLADEVLNVTASENFEVYGFYGISVFAEIGGATRDDLLAGKLVKQEIVAVFKAGDLRAAGLELRPTGVLPHYDVVHSDLGELVARLINCPHDVIQNEYYEPPEEVATDG